MNGTTMTVRISAAVKMPVPNGGPAKMSSSTGTPSNVSIRVGSTYCDMIGTITKKPHMP